MNAKPVHDDSPVETNPQPRANGLADAKVKQPDSGLVRSEYSPYTGIMFRYGPAPTPIIDFMTERKISAETAAYYGLDQDEAHLALLYAAASKEATQNTLTATPEEAARLKCMKRLASLALDLCQRLKVAALLPKVLVDERQADLAGQLSGTSQELCKLEKTLFGELRTPKDDLVTNAEAGRRAYRRANPVSEPEAPHLTA